MFAGPASLSIGFGLVSDLGPGLDPPTSIQYKIWAGSTTHILCVLCGFLNTMQFSSRFKLYTNLGLGSGLHVSRRAGLGQLLRARSRPESGLDIYFRSWAGPGIDIP